MLLPKTEPQNYQIMGVKVKGLVKEEVLEILTQQSSEVIEDFNRIGFFYLCVDDVYFGFTNDILGPDKDFNPQVSKLIEEIIMLVDFFNNAKIYEGIMTVLEVTMSKITLWPRVNSFTGRKLGTLLTDWKLKKVIDLISCSTIEAIEQFNELQVLVEYEGKIYFLLHEMKDIELKHLQEGLSLYHTIKEQFNSFSSFRSLTGSFFVLAAKPDVVWLYGVKLTLHEGYRWLKMLFEAEPHIRDDILKANLTHSENQTPYIGVTHYANEHVVRDQELGMKLWGKKLSMLRYEGSRQLIYEFVDGLSYQDSAAWVELE